MTLNARVPSQSVLEFVSWDFEAIIGIKPLKISCHKAAVEMKE